MKQIDVTVLNKKDYAIYMKLKELLINGCNDRELINIFDSIIKSLEFGIYPIIYIDEAALLIKDKYDNKTV